MIRSAFGARANTSSGSPLCSERETASDGVGIHQTLETSRNQPATAAGSRESGIEYCSEVNRAEVGQMPIFPAPVLPNSLFFFSLIDPAVIRIRPSDRNLDLIGASTPL